MAPPEAPGGVGVLGSAFNPPHIGHLILAQEAIDQLGLRRLIVVPTGRAPHKRIDPEPGPRVRLELCRLAFEGMPGVEVSALEVEREEVSWAYRTLELIADEVQDQQLTFVMGADAAAGLGDWEKPHRVLELARVAVARRPGVEAASVERALRRLGMDGGPEWISMPAVEVSSTAVRDRVAAARPLKWLVPDAVITAIDERGLYTDGGAD